MAQLLRIEFPGAVYHATSRGDRLEPIFADDSGAEARHVARDAEAAAQPPATLQQWLAACGSREEALYVRR